MTPRVFSVTAVNRYVKQLLESDMLTSGLFIEGEISNFNAHASGHYYFTLKDAGASISAVMFRSGVQTLKFKPKAGHKVTVYGKLSLYEKTGSYQFYVEMMEPAGIGALQLAFNELKEKLEKEGLFRTDRKRPIPQFAKTIAMITSGQGAAVQDMIRVVRDKNPAVRLLVVPALVQGDAAPKDLIRALKLVNAHGEADVIILGRGGGSMEDLWAFNDEALARVIVASRIPVISAVGHETDFTIADFAADLRAPTPTAAAQLAAYDHAQMVQHILALSDALTLHIKRALVYKHRDVKTLMNQMARAFAHRMDMQKQQLAHLEILLEARSPYAAFKRGYAMVTDAEDHVVVSGDMLYTGQPLMITFENSQAAVTVSDGHKQRLEH